MATTIRSSYRTLLTHLLRIPDPEIQARYRGMCRAASRAGLQVGTEGEPGAGTGTKGNRYSAQIRREIRRLETISRFLPPVNPDEKILTTTTPPPRNQREARQERKCALRAYERMVSATYARTGARRWQVLEVLYPSSTRVPSSPPPPPRKNPLSPSHGHQNRALPPPAPPTVPPYLLPLERTVNLTAQAHRERSLKQLFGSPAYLQALQRKKEWRRWSKFVKGVQVPLGLRFGDVSGGEEVRGKEEWKETGERLLDCAQGIAQRSSLPPRENGGTACGEIVHLLRYGSSRREAPSNNTLPTTSSAGTRRSAATGTTEVPRSIRRIYERMVARVPVLRCAAVGARADTATEVGMAKEKRKGRGTEMDAGTTGTRPDAGWSLAGEKGWIPPRASEEEMRWILGK